MPNSDTERKLHLPSIEVGFGTKAGLAGAAGQALAAIILAAESKDPTSIVFAIGAVVTLLTVVSARFAQFLAITKRVLEAIDTPAPDQPEESAPTLQPISAAEIMRRMDGPPERSSEAEGDDSTLELSQGSPNGAEVGYATIVYSDDEVGAL